ncbi:chromate transporter [Vagococcus fluvialis]|uniref:chromate transporter n=1 Tax=Vagococcus fluvialis TaxID=2738 RepID=UPI003D101EBD
MIHLFFVFLKIGFLGFGGGYAMLSLILSEFTNLGLTLNQFADMNALDVIIPGPIAINSATYVGQLTHGLTGSFIATMAVCIPSFLFVPVFNKYEKQIYASSRLNKALELTKLAAISLIFSTALAIGAETTQLFTSSIDYLSLIILLTTLGLYLKYSINPIILTILAGVVSFLLS